jgi:hypothetical protein
LTPLVCPVASAVENETPVSCDVSGTDHARQVRPTSWNGPGRRLAGHGLIELGKPVDVCLYRELKAYGCDAAAELDHIHRR